jgi:hypothetical protein
MKTSLLKSRIALVAAACFAFQTVPGHAALITVSHWRMGENDTGMYVFGGALVVTYFTDLINIAALAG